MLVFPTDTCGFGDTSGLLLASRDCRAKPFVCFALGLGLIVERQDVCSDVGALSDDILCGAGVVIRLEGWEYGLANLR